MKILLYCKNIRADKKALEVTVEQALAFNASVTLISCIDQEPEVPTAITREMTEKASAMIHDYIDKILTPAGISCKSEVIISTSFCGEKIVQYAEENEADLIIMGIRKRSKVGKMFFGSISQHIILEAPCKVLTVK